MSVDWVACDTCYTKTDGTESVGGIERTELDFPGVMPKIKISLEIQKVLLVTSTMEEAG